MCWKFDSKDSNIISLRISTTMNSFSFYCFRSNVVVPIIEVLNADTLAYNAANNPDQRGGFGWDLMYKWKPIPLEEQKMRKSHIDVIRYVKKSTFAFRIFSFSNL